MQSVGEFSNYKLSSGYQKVDIFMSRTQDFNKLGANSFL